MTQTQDTKLKAAVKRARNQMPEPPIYQETVEALRYDPTAPVTVRPPYKRERRAGRTLTDRVMASLNADGTVDPTKAVPSYVVTTGELPTIEGTKEESEEEVEVQ